MDTMTADDEVTITLNLNRISLTVKGNNDEAIRKLFDTAIEMIEKNKDRIKKLLSYGLGDHTTSDIGAATEESQKTSNVSSFPATTDGKPILGGKVQLVEDYVKFVSPNSFKLLQKEAVAVVMRVLDKPLQPKEIDYIMKRGWKKVSNVNALFFAEKHLKRYVVSLSEGYILTEEGKRWVDEQVLTKL
jgi:hypothetical protein